jgi:hypothetical protein
VIRAHGKQRRALVKLMRRAMRARVNRIHPALKHGAYTATAVLPGESRAAFEKLYRELIAEHAPSGVHEEHIVMDLARLLWRKQNLGTLRIAERAQHRWSATRKLGFLIPVLDGVISEEHNKKVEEESLIAVRNELGDAFELVEIGNCATFDGLTKELEVEERLDAAINRCLKQLLLLRGLKSISAAPSPKRIPRPS